MPSYTNPQSLNRFSYVLDNPLKYTDPTGHRECEDYGGTCLSEKQVTQNYEAKLHKHKNKNKGHGNGGNPPDFFSSLAYGADAAGVVLADSEMVVVDTIGALVIGEGCATGAACLPAIGTAGFIDYAVSFYSPLGGAENGAGFIALAATVVADYQSGTSYLGVDRNQITIGVGKDTAVSFVNFVAGMVPEANFDAWISNKQLQYDNKRRSGQLSGTTLFEINIPRITIPPPIQW